MAKKRKAKKTAKKKIAKSKKRAAPARRKAKAKSKPKSARSKRRAANTRLAPRAKSASRPMTQPGPEVTPIAARPSPFPSSVPGDFPTKSPDGKN